ncbi:MAG: SMP-30/gluconolactonase/LRE family protein [Planctomycetota bacterium]|jgi:sugar lactone lactonase YvrE
MTKIEVTIVATFIGTAMIFSGCPKDQPADMAAAELAVEKTVVIKNLDLPECIVIDSDSGKVYVSNVVTASEAYWVDDSNGFISLMSPDGKIEKLHWLDSSPAMQVNSPKGMCILDGKLYFNDNNKLKHCSLKLPRESGIIALPGAKKLNDLATDGKSIWVTDTEAGKVFCVQPDRSIREIPSPDSINGITCYKGKLFAVSWGLHEVYELDPVGKKAPVPFGLASHFTALDGIEVLDDGTFIVSDYKGNKVCSISPDRKTVRTLIELETPADFGLDRDNRLLYVPEMLSNRAVILKLEM